MSEHALHKIAHLHKRAAARNECSTCWLLSHNCICNDICPLPRLFQSETNIGTATPTFRLIILMHFKEYRRASNTGKIWLRMSNIANDNGKIGEFRANSYLYGVPSSMEEFTQLVKSLDVTKSFILFPSETAISIEEFIGKSGSRSGSGSSGDSTINIILLDGTWSNAKNMYKWIQKDIFHTYKGSKAKDEAIVE
eukprot:TRINITY_DN8715_c0_g1_i1.p1 TRINITY_DN8715_c0_g1~~TRINITY_DN8715_c0_g1_i1.p1  ORF type:complete len:215 (+),score=53.73 TRINITY_DN8715_c0_g1_i1:62-646(+)